MHVFPGARRTCYRTYLIATVKEILEGRQIEPSDSPWGSPVVLVTQNMDPRASVRTTAG